MIKGIVITLLMMELLSETTVEPKIPTMPQMELLSEISVESKIPTMPHNEQGQCLTEDMKVIEC